MPEARGVPTCGRKAREQWLALGWRPGASCLEGRHHQPRGAYQGRASMFNGGCAYPTACCQGDVLRCSGCGLQYCRHHRQGNAHDARAEWVKATPFPADVRPYSRRPGVTRASGAAYV